MQLSVGCDKPAGSLHPLIWTDFNIINQHKAGKDIFISGVNNMVSFLICLQSVPKGTIRCNNILLYLRILS